MNLNRETQDIFFHIPLATNTVQNDSVINNADTETKEHFKSDISFIGSTYAEKCPFNRTKLPEFEKGFADGLIEAQLKVYGYNFIEDVISNAFCRNLFKIYTWFIPLPSKLSRKQQSFGRTAVFKRKGRRAGTPARVKNASQ